MASGPLGLPMKDTLKQFTGCRNELHPGGAVPTVRTSPHMAKAPNRKTGLKEVLMELTAYLMHLALMITLGKGH